MFRKLAQLFGSDDWSLLDNEVVGLGCCESTVENYGETPIQQNIRSALGALRNRQR
jgi:hypothetical protein